MSKNDLNKKSRQLRPPKNIDPRDLDLDDFEEELDDIKVKDTIQKRGQ